MKNFVIGILLIAFASCNNPAEPSKEKAADYMPLTAGSTWEYFYNGPYAYGMNLETGSDTIINGKTYRTQRAEVWNDVAKTYRFSGDDIYELDWRYNEELIFKMAPVGTTWSSKRVHDSVNYSVVTSSVAAKDLTVDVYSNTFKNVIHIRSLVKNHYESGTSNEYVYNRYFAKGVGIIKEYMEDGNPWFNGLKTYSIK